jgi:hypothetical protein
MTSLSVDTGRLSQEAGTLGGQASPIGGASSELTTGTASAMGALGSVNDDGLHSALQRLGEAWGYEIAAIGSDLSSVSAVMNGLAQAYSQWDTQSAAAVRTE